MRLGSANDPALLRTQGNGGDCSINVCCWDLHFFFSQEVQHNTLGDAGFSELLSLTVLKI